MKHEVARKRRTAQRAAVRLRLEQYGEGGANVRRIILREQEGNFECDWSTHKGGWEAVNG
jgi:hypothetical protein